MIPTLIVATCLISLGSLALWSIEGRLHTIADTLQLIEKAQRPTTDKWDASLQEMREGSVN